MKKERAALETIMNSGYIPKSITELFDKARVGAIRTRNGTIYFLDIPDTIRDKLPSDAQNAKRWCVRAASLDTDFNRWLWRIGTNAPDLDETWKSGKTSRILWDLLVKEFRQQNPGLPPDEPRPPTRYQPTREDFDSACDALHRRTGEKELDYDLIFDEIEARAKREGKALAGEWRERLESELDREG
jgi:hypothetical protein